MVIQEVNMVISIVIMSQERLDRYIKEAAQSAAYEEGFGFKAVTFPRETGERSTPDSHSGNRLKMTVSVSTS